MAAAPRRRTARRSSAKRRTRRVARRRSATTPKAPKRSRRRSARSAVKKKSSKKAKRVKKVRKTTRRARKPKKAKTVGKKWQVFKGTRLRTVGGLTKADLAISKSGKVVSKKKLERGRKMFKSTRLSTWINAIARAREELNLTGFVPCKKGSEYYKLTRKYFDASK